MDSGHRPRRPPPPPPPAPPSDDAPPPRWKKRRGERPSLLPPPGSIFVWARRDRHDGSRLHPAFLLPGTGSCARVRRASTGAVARIPKSSDVSPPDDDDDGAPSSRLRIRRSIGGGGRGDPRSHIARVCNSRLRTGSRTPEEGKGHIGIENHQMRTAIGESPKSHGEVQSTRRTSKRKVHQLPASSCLRGEHNQRNKSSLQLHLERVIESDGIGRILQLVRAATDREVDELNASAWTPLVGAIFLLGKDTTAKGNTAESEERLLQLVGACHRRGISLNSSAWFGARVHRALTVAAYYGFYSAVRFLVESGALPDLRDGEGQNAFISAFQKPVGRNNRLRWCDERTAGELVELGVVTSDFGLWKRSPRGTMCYVNDCTQTRSAMYSALANKNVDAIRFLRNAGGVITDRDYLSLRRRGRAKVRSCLLPMVAEVLSGCHGTGVTAEVAVSKDGIRTKSQLLQGVKSWNPQIDWSFPPTWKVGVALCQDCGLPPAIFRSHVVPYLDRDWFYAETLLVFDAGDG